MYKSLNRTVLYQLSRPISSVADQTNILDALHKLTVNRSLILGPGNYDQEFIGCLCYCLLQLTANNPTNIRFSVEIDVKLRKCMNFGQSKKSWYYLYAYVSTPFLTWIHRQTLLPILLGASLSAATRAAFFIFLHFWYILSHIKLAFSGILSLRWILQ